MDPHLAFNLEPRRYTGEPVNPIQDPVVSHQGDNEDAVLLTFARDHIDLQRGDILGYRKNAPDYTPTHMATAYATKDVYCGDTQSATGEFHHDALDKYPTYPECIEDGWNLATTYVTIWRKK